MYRNAILKSTFVLFMLVNSMNSYAQNIHGKVLSSDEGTPLSGATIRVLVSDTIYVTGFTTNNKGRFSQDIKMTDYTLEISYVGYEKNIVLIQNKELKNMNLGEIRLTPTSVDLGNVEVVAQSMVHKADKIIAYPNSRQINASGSSLSLLQNMLLPHLFVDPVQEKVSIQGTSGVIYRINGIKASFEEIKAIRPEQIYRIDYKPTPYIRELDSNSGTIDFILKQSNTGTSISTSALSAVSTGMVNGNLNMRSNYKKSQLALDYNVNYRDYSKRKNSEVETYAFPDGDLTWEKRGEYAPFGYTQHNIGIGYLFKGNKDVVNIRFNNYINDQHDNNLMYVYQSKQKLLNRKIHSGFSNYTPSLDFTYSRKLNDTQGVEINMVGTLSDNEYERTLNDFYEEGGQTEETRNASDGSQKSIIGEAFYWKEGKNINFSAGVRSTYQYAHNHYLSNDDVKLRNFLAYPYIQLSGKICKISYTVGTGVNYRKQKQNEESVDYVRNTSSLSLSYIKDKWSLKYTVSYRSFFPSLSSLSEVVQPIDTLSLSKGNSRLKPYSSLKNQIDYTLSDNKKFISMLTLVADKSFNPISEDIFFSPADNKFIYQENNQKYNVKYGAQLLIQVINIMKLFTVQAVGGWNHYKSKGYLYEHTYDNFYYGIYAAMTYKNLNINGAWSKPRKNLFGHYLITSENYSYIGANYKMNRLNVGCGLQFPFTSGSEYRTERLAENARSDRKVLIRNNRNMFYMSLSYNINWGRSIFQSNKRLQNSDNSNSIIRINDN